MPCYSKLQCSAIVTSEASDCVKKILGLLADVYLHPLSKFHEFPCDDSSLGHDTVAGYSGACHHPHSWATKQVSSVTELSQCGDIFLWKPILTFSFMLGLWGTCRTTNPANKSKAILAISVTCLSPENQYRSKQLMLTRS